ncbi:MAG: hypothetical protein ACXW2E_07720, partial [Nitrososphaeraceae archaeon]
MINNHSNWHFNRTDILNTNNIRNVNSGCDVLDFNSSNTNLPGVNIFHKDVGNDYTLTSKDVIRKINPVVLPRVSAIANIGL